jgi:thiamine biosynthesis protein ThiS
MVNGESRAIAEGATVADLLAELGVGGRRIAVEINLDVVPAGEYATRTIASGDRVEIVHFVGGG